MSFVSPPPAPAPDAPSTLQNDGWWPDVDVEAMREAVRIDAAWTAERVREAAAVAVLSVNRELAAWKAERVLEGFESLAEVDVIASGPTPMIGDESALLVHYRRAVQSYAAADLADRLGRVGSTAPGKEREEQLGLTCDDHRRNARWAIADLQEKSRSTIGLL